MRRIIVIAFVVLLLAALILSGCAKPAPTTTPPTSPPPTTPPATTVQWKYVDFIPPMDTYAKTAEAWAKDLETASNGRIKITFYHAESLVKMPDEFDAVAAGTADFAMIDANLTPAKLVLSGIMTLPMLFNHTSQAQQVNWALLQKYQAFSNEYAPTKVIWCQNPGPTNLFINKQPVKVLDDFKGLKLSAVVPVEGEALKTLGAVPVSLPPVDWFVSLERGVVDGISADWNGGFIFKINEISKYRTDNFNLTMRVSPIIMNINSYNKLPPDLKAIFDKVTDGLALSKSSGLAYEDFMANSIKIMKDLDTKAGNPPFYVLPNDERQRWMEKLLPIRDKWVSDMKAKGLPGDAMLKDLIAFNEQYK